MDKPARAPMEQVYTSPMAEVLSRISSELTSTNEMLQTIQQHYSVLMGSLDTESSTFKDLQNLDLATQLVADLASAVAFLAETSDEQSHCNTIALSEILTLQALRGSLCDIPTVPNVNGSESGAFDLF
ncbi:hypothetical protein R3X27_03420 [Tropicimonas sp. TH_r6]|uniref:hypothetical protein n=1 Tax=Tropicimonas sp. TH_r6 TaxID=3082085 RepID=UPI002952F4F9|nr:hypothetical protein [Tropicimonas sp. TH_r6]MDV7141727.1 hypothetical protein [Tropicimonas sp. TH_r6]